MVRVEWKYMAKHSRIKVNAMRKHLNLNILLLLCIMLTLSPVTAQAPEAYVISMWTFDRAIRYEADKQLEAEHNQPLAQGILQIHGGAIEEDGSEGRPHTDYTCGQRYKDTSAIQWDDISGPDASTPDDDAQVTLSFSTVDWEVSYLFFYYHSKNAGSFDVSYHLGDGNWQQVADDVVISDTSNWDNIAVDLSGIDDMYNRELVVIRIHDLAHNNSNGRFRMDNVAVMGKRISKPNDCPPQIEMVTPLDDIGIVLNSGTFPTYTGDRGFEFIVTDDQDSTNELTVFAITTDPNVINKLSLTTLDEVSGRFRLEIGEPHGYAGVANIILRVSDSSGNTTEISSEYGATSLEISPINNFHQGTANASAGAALNSDTMIIANDTDQRLGIYQRSQSGEPLATFDVTQSLELDVLSDGSIPPVVIESATSRGNRQYWLGSHSNTERGKEQINSYHLFATEVNGAGANAQLTVIGSYADLFAAMEDWSEGYDYNFKRAIERGERTTNPNGFKIEGFALSPNRQRAYIGLRTPLVPPNNRTNALIVQILDFETWFNNGNPDGIPTFGAPILFDLQGLGIRGMECNVNGCVIIAGAIDDTEEFALYTWSGRPQDAPILRNVDLEGLHPESVILNANDSLQSGTTIQLVSDSDQIDWYRAGRRGDRLAINLRLFRSNIITLD
jgi:hypothetical protein